MKSTHLPVAQLIKDSMKKDINNPLTFKNFSLKKTFIGEWKNFFIFVLLMFLVWSYMHDTKECREVLENIGEICTEYLAISNNPNINVNYLGGENGTRITWQNNQSGISSIIPPDR